MEILQDRQEEYKHYLATDMSADYGKLQFYRGAIRAYSDILQIDWSEE